ncbi:hypothetical protein KQX54_005628 [Cotesia glomerata]|uniref:Tyrosine-protein phosphatase domain-containing protein n=1 Tax=Cotesia glomerata TaxID=32391 RepID=A0AAV7IQ46_COTGL|nr:hypothetical protein KQX54_005628 [Cotesia glomerata]
MGSSADKVETHLCRHAMKPSNREKNQNQRCIPYDYNRVVLDTIEGQTDSDYINASYVDSLLKPNAYIVTQGPIETTVTEFWRMVWQERASCIVMLTKTFDFIKINLCDDDEDRDRSYKYSRPDTFPLSMHQECDVSIYTTVVTSGLLSIMTVRVDRMTMTERERMSDRSYIEPD